MSARVTFEERASAMKAAVDQAEEVRAAARQMFPDSEDAQRIVTEGCAKLLATKRKKSE